MKLKISNILLLFTIIFLSSVNINCNYFISGGDPTIDPSNIGNVEGIVKDLSTGNSIDGVTIKIDDVSAATGISGIYNIKNVGAGDRLITAEKTGYQFYSNTVRIVKGSTTTHNIQMLKVKAGSNPS